jgi:hypothetical protein
LKKSNEKVYLYFKGVDGREKALNDGASSCCKAGDDAQKRGVYV